MRADLLIQGVTFLLTSLCESIEQVRVTTLLIITSMDCEDCVDSPSESSTNELMQIAPNSPSGLTTSCPVRK